MLTPLTTHLAQVVMAGGINTNGIVNWITTNLVPIVIAAVAIVIMAKALGKGGGMSDAFSKMTIVIAGVFLLGAAFALHKFGDNLANLAF